MALHFSYKLKWNFYYYKGPLLYGLFGRKTGSVPGYDYTQANKDKGW